jgi:hypothetical protein
LVFGDDRRQEKKRIQFVASSKWFWRISVRHGVTVSQPGLAVMREMRNPPQDRDIFLARLGAIENQFDSAIQIFCVSRHSHREIAHSAGHEHIEDFVAT